MARSSARWACPAPTARSAPRRRLTRCSRDRRLPRRGKRQRPRSLMGLTSLFYPWGLILQAVAVLHFVRRRPDTYWLWIILIGGGLGALVYIVAEVAPDVDLMRGAFDAMGRRRRIRHLEAV